MTKPALKVSELSASPSLNKSGGIKEHGKKVGCCFSGIGGFAKGFQNQGFQILWAIEKDKNATLVFKKNFPMTNTINKEINKCTFGEDGISSVDVITAGIPCQPFSIAGEARGELDVRSQGVFELLDFIASFESNKPKVILCENVRGFLSYGGGKFFNKIKSIFFEHGYILTKDLSNIYESFRDTGIPQFRERLFFTALRRDIALGYYTGVDLGYGTATRLMGKGFIDIRRKRQDKYYLKATSKYLNMFKTEFLKIKKSRKEKTTYLLRRNYVRSNKREICFTLVSAMGTGGHNVPVVKDRWGFRKITPSECARLQGWKAIKIPVAIPDSEVYRLIGNSVVVKIVEKIANNIKHNLLKNKI